MIVPGELIDMSMLHIAIGSSHRQTMARMQHWANIRQAAKGLKCKFLACSSNPP